MSVATLLRSLLPARLSVARWSALCALIGLELPSGACAGTARIEPLPSEENVPAVPAAQPDAPQGGPAGERLAAAPVPMILGLATPVGTTTTRDRDGDGCTMQSCSQTLVTPGGTAETIQASLYATLLSAGFEELPGSESHGSRWSRCGTLVRFSFGDGEYWAYEWYPKDHINETSSQGRERAACEDALAPSAGGSVTSTSPGAPPR